MISIVMAVCQQDEISDLQRCIESMLLSINENDEILVVHDGPHSHRVKSFLDKQQYPFLKFCHTTQQNGLTDCVNLGVSLSKNLWIARMDPDDVCVPDRFIHQKSLLSADTTIDILVGSIEEHFNGRRKIRLCKVLGFEVPEKYWLRNPIFNVTAIIRKEVFLAVGGYLKFVNFIDYYFWCRVFKRKFKVFGDNKVMVHVNIGNDIGKRRGGLSYALSELRFYSRLREDGIINPFQFLFACGIRVPIRVLPRPLRNIIWKIRQ